MSFKPFTIVRPVTITAAKLTASNVDELDATYDPAAWNGATAYLIGDQVARAATHRIYQRRTDGTTPTAPEDDPTNWADIGATNRHKMFDGSYQSQTQRAESIVQTIAPGEFADALVVLNAHAAEINVQVTGTAYNETITMRNRDVENWWDFWFEPPVYKEKAAFFALPMGTDKSIVLTVSNPGGVAKLGECVPGLSKELGGTKLGARSWLIDYSVKADDGFGNIDAQEGPYSTGITVDVVVKNGFVDELQRTLAPYRAKRAVYIGGGNTYESLMAYGFYENLETIFENTKESTCQFRIQGVT